MTAPLLIDSGFLYALFDHDDRYHRAVAEVAGTEGGIAIVPDVVLVEVAFLIRRAGGIPAVVRFLENFAKAGFRLEALTMPDINRARELIDTYADARLDFVDVCIIATAERLDVRRVGTVDSRDFLIVRPAHCEHLDILPPVS
jgi:predicted nucleic acid-binding protein